MGTKRSRYPPGVCVCMGVVMVAGRGSNKGKGKSRRHSPNSCLPTEEELESSLPCTAVEDEENQKLCSGGSRVSGAPCLGPPPAYCCWASASTPMFALQGLEGQASLQTYRRPCTAPGSWPPVGAPDTLGENTHTCLLFQGSQLRTAPWCTNARGPQ